MCVSRLKVDSDRKKKKKTRKNFNQAEIIEYNHDKGRK